jgi:2,4-dienoyl-CoA reductase-like NADH-dependent reductase (Old Yellow Enzyme family)
MNAPLLFTPLAVGPLTLPNRIMVSPMCQYSGTNGNANDWHMAHIGSLALSGAGLLFVEATSVSPEGRITAGCLGLYNDENHQSLKRVVDAVRAISPIKLAIQLGHAGRKASSHRPWEGGALMTPQEGGWETIAPSALPHKSDETAPKAMTADDIARLTAEFVATTKRARELGFDVIELHCAHGYLLHEFLSPLSNQRTDQYGGSLENRMRLPLAIFDAVREAAGPDIAVGARLSATDWAEGGWDLEQSIAFSRQLQAHGADFIDVSSGGVAAHQKITIGPGYQVPFAEAIRKAIDIPVIAVGLITEPQQAEDILQQGKADIVALARAFVSDPRWPWRAAAALGGKVAGCPPYFRCLPHGSPPIFGDVTTAQR